MSDSSQRWQQLCHNAEYWHLDMTKFNCLAEFFTGLDLAFFDECAGKATRKFPWDEVMRRYPADRLEKFLLLCLVANYPEFKEFYHREELPDSMFQAIARDLRLWVDILEKDLGGYGLSPRIFAWELSCITGEVKQIGRLQFNDIHHFQPEYSIYRNADGSVEARTAFRRKNPPAPLLSYGDKVINLHIPADGALKPEDCRDSIATIRRFVEERYPDYEYRAVVCCSWLLDAQFRELLPEASNIIPFQKLGYNVRRQDHDATQEVIWRLWGNAGLELAPASLPVWNTMTRNVARFLQQGGRFYEGILIIPQGQKR